MRVVFMGSSAASAVCLKAILREPSLEVVGVVTQPDRPAGRGKTLTPCPCKAYAQERNLTAIITPENVNDDGAMAVIRAWNPEVIAVVAFGQFLKKPLLELPRFGCINCHFSLLPKYRGASPVVAALAAGDKVTGVTVMQMGEGMDDGPILMQSFEPIYSDVTGGELMEGLSVVGGVTLAKVLSRLSMGETLTPIPQNPDDATRVRKLTKADGRIDFSEPVIVIERKIRAYNPWPGSHTFLPLRLRRHGQTGRLVVAKAEIYAQLNEAQKAAMPGTVIALDRRGPVVKCADTAILLLAVKPEGGALMNGDAFLRGRPLVVGDDVFLGG